MAFSVDNNSRNAIQAIQFELWPDCNNGCEYCYLKGTQRHTSQEQKSKNILQTIEDITNPEIMKDYNAIGLIGGEFFQNQLLGVTKEWAELINTMADSLSNDKIQEVWIATSLIFNDLLLFQKTLDILDKVKLKPTQRITICTSYDTVGRFKNQHSLDLWKRNVKWIKENYPNISLHTQVILTQDTIEKLIADPSIFSEVQECSTIDFRYPSISRADCPTATGIKDYRAMMLKKKDEFPPKFFIESRETFIKFLNILNANYGITKVQNLIHQPEMRSRRLKIYVEDYTIEDRWNDTRDVYLPCGHLVDGLCYINDENHCIYCDIEKFIKNKEMNNV